MKDYSSEFKTIVKTILKDYDGKIGAFIILIGNDDTTSTSIAAPHVRNLGKMISNSMKDQPIMADAVKSAFGQDAHVVIASKPEDLDLIMS